MGQTCCKPNTTETNLQGDGGAGAGVDLLDTKADFLAKQQSKQDSVAYKHQDSKSMRDQYKENEMDSFARKDSIMNDAAHRGDNSVVGDKVGSMIDPQQYSRTGSELKRVGTLNQHDSSNNNNNNTGNMMNNNNDDTRSSKTRKTSDHVSSGAAVGTISATGGIGDMFADLPKPPNLRDMHKASGFQKSKFKD